MLCWILGGIGAMAVIARALNQHWLVGDCAATTRQGGNGSAGSE
ncbi:MAG TPA: hypothetical protein VJ890_26130 [Vineibacter sp.]|nr:hypothetical protein [Vineibacter sp.]